MVICKYFQEGYCRFGQNCKNEHVFANKYSYKAPQVQNTRNDYDNFRTSFNTGNTYGNTNASSIFRSAVQNTSPLQTQSASVFAQNPHPRPSVFDRLGAQQSFGEQNQAKSIFANANQNAFAPAHTNNFQSQNQIAAKSLFAQASRNIFGHSPTNFNPAPVAANVFDSTAAQNLHRDPFKQHQQPSKQSSPFEGCSSVFKISDGPASNVFGITVQQSNSEDDSVYSETKVLSQADIEAFESNEFKLGYIPELPPPRTLCV